jgi:hypothetical protein
MEALRCSLFPRFTEGPLAVPEFHKDSIQLPMRKKSQASGLKGFMGGSMHKDVNLEEICSLVMFSHVRNYPLITSVVPVKVEIPQERSVSSASKQPVAQLDERAAREKLLGSESTGQKQSANPDKAKQLGGQANELKGTLAETRDRLNERGQRVRCNCSTFPLILCIN